MWTEIIFLVFGLMFGIFICMFVWIEYDKRKEKRLMHTLYNPDGFCFEHCKLFEEVDSQCKDTDDVWKIMDSKKYCGSCPICIAQDIIDRDEANKHGKR